MSYTLHAGTNWKNIKVGVKITSAAHAAGGVELSIPSRIMIRESVSYDIIDGINKYNQGVAAKPHRYTFAVTVPANTDTSRLLKALLSDEEPFDFDLIDVDPTINFTGPVTTTSGPGDFRFLGERLIDCYLTDKEITVEIGAVPYVVFNGIALGYDPKIYISSSKTVDWISAQASGLFYGDSVPSNMTLLRTEMIKDSWKTPGA
jgi:hypothetical protein